ncbi:MAG: trypsin-like peptidase domain-containing protein [Desulfuromonadales bacterium]|nr:trypsin-like peptidase domain-containing protein [Desulfuromonadales bacterium]MBN2793470.1 trypsin-like peptidase domain-containing protein [Desulfuromonadales bacterium]
MDLISDLAVIRIPPNSALPEIKFAKKWSYAVGDQVMAIGYPLGIGKTASSGIVSALERVIPLSTFSWMMPYIQTDAPISPGNSGGPLVNLCGEIIGINTLHLINGQNINFAIPVGLIEELVPQLIDSGHVSRTWYGIYGQIISFPMAMSLNISPGFLVETIEPGSPAEKIGLRGGTYPARFGFREFLLGGDVLTSVNGVSLDDLETVAEVVRSFNVGDCVEVEYWRNGKIAKVEVLLPERPELPGDARWLFSRQADK